MTGVTNALEALADAPHFNEWMAQIVQPYVGSRTLEIGAGIGNLTEQFIASRFRFRPGVTIRCGERYVASDVDEDFVDRLRAKFHTRPNLEVIDLDVTSPGQCAAYGLSFDSVICLNVLEHIACHRTALANIYEMLEPGGTAIILVPCDPALFNSLDLELGHIRRYSHERLQAVMEDNGFNVERIIPFNRAGRFGWWLNGNLLKRKHLNRFQLKCFDRMVWLIKMVDRFLPWGPLSIIAIGRKPVGAK